MLLHLFCWWHLFGVHHLAPGCHVIRYGHAPHFYYLITCVAGH